MRWLLLVAMWPGPFPWCHRHGTLADANPAEKPWLAVHLQSHHASDEPNANSFCGWHVHFDYPDPPSKGTDRPAKPDPVRFLTGGADGGRVELIRNPSLFEEELATRSAPLAKSTDDCIPCSRVATHFFDSFAPTLALPVRLGVVRC